MVKDPEDEKALSAFLNGKSALTLDLLQHFVAEFKTIGKVTIHPAKTMIGVANDHKRVAWITQLGKNFVDVVFPFERPFNDNLCFQKIAQVPGDTKQFNHHFRMLHKEDVNEEVKEFMKRAFEGRDA